MSARRASTSAGARPRYRLYGGAELFLRAARDALLGAQHTADEAPAVEAALRAFFGVPHALLAPMARVAIHDVVRALVQPGGRVLLSPYTIVDVVNAVLAAGATPGFVDVDPQTGNLDPAALARALRPGDAAVLITHLHGVTADIEGALDVARRAGLPVIEDAAQALGAAVPAGRVGTLGEAGVFSFGSFKNVNAHFGGAITTHNAALAARLRELAEGRPPLDPAQLRRKLRASLTSAALFSDALFPRLTAPVIRFGELYDVEPIRRLTRIELETHRRPALPPWWFHRPTDLQHRAIPPQLAHVDAHADARIAAARRYLDGLDGLGQDLILPPPPQGRRHVYTYVAAQVAPGRRPHLLRELQRARCDVAPQHLHDVSALPDFAAFGGPCPNASRVAQAVVLLPTWPGYGEAAIDRVVVATRRALAAGDASGPR